MLKTLLIALFVGAFLNGCGSQTESKMVVSVGVEESDKKAIQEVLLRSLSEPKNYEEVAWRKLKSSDKVASRIQKKAIFIAHSFKSKNLYGGSAVRENIYFIGPGKPSLIIDFDVKAAFGDFLANKTFATLFVSTPWNFEQLQVAYKKSSSESESKQKVKDFLYSIGRLNAQEQESISNAIISANNPMSVANNMAIFLTMRSFPEVLEELLFDEVNYSGK